MESIFKENNIFYNLFCVFLTEQNKFCQKDAKLYWRTVVHGIGMAHHCYVFVFAQTLDFSEHDDPNIRDLKIYGPRFLTAWNFAFQSIFLLLALSHDLAEWCGRARTTPVSRVRYWRDTVFSALVVPYTLFVTTMFWSLYFIDREIVYPKKFDAVIPPQFNHCVHSWIVAVVASELVMRPAGPPRDRTLGYTLCWTFSILYAVVYYTTYYQIGRWLYPVFGLFTWWQVCLFQLGIWTSVHLFYELQWPILFLIHGDVKNDPAVSGGDTVGGNGEGGNVTGDNVKGDNVKGVNVNGMNVKGDDIRGEI